MKKGCIGVLIGLPLLILGGGGGALYWSESQYGWSVAEPVGHETRTVEDTRYIAVLKPAKLVSFLNDLVPKERLDLPAWLPWGPEEVLAEVLPREVAVIGGADYAAGEIALEVFINERRGGPFVDQRLNLAEAMANQPVIDWEQPLLRLERRGVLTARGVIPMSGRVEELVLEHWVPKEGPSASAIEGGHLLEVVVDNRDGDGMAVLAAVLQAYNVPLDQVFADPTLQKILTGVAEVRLTANITGPDEITAHLRAPLVDDADFLTRTSILFLVNEQGFQFMQQLFRQNLGLELNYLRGKKAELKDNTLVGHYTITGFRARIQAQIDRAFPPPADAGGN